MKLPDRLTLSFPLSQKNLHILIFQLMHRPIYILSIFDITIRRNMQYTNSSSPHFRLRLLVLAAVTGFAQHAFAKEKEGGFYHYWTRPKGTAVCEFTHSSGARQFLECDEDTDSWGGCLYNPIEPKIYCCNPGVEFCWGSSGTCTGAQEQSICRGKDATWCCNADHSDCASPVASSNKLICTAKGITNPLLTFDLHTRTDLGNLTLHPSPSSSSSPPPLTLITPNPINILSSHTTENTTQTTSTRYNWYPTDAGFPKYDFTPLKPGQVAGAVVGSLVGFAALGGGALVWYRKNKAAEAAAMGLGRGSRSRRRRGGLEALAGAGMGGGRQARGQGEPDFLTVPEGFESTRGDGWLQSELEQERLTAAPSRTPWRVNAAQGETG